MPAKTDQNQDNGQRDDRDDLSRVATRPSQRDVVQLRRSRSNAIAGQESLQILGQFCINVRDIDLAHEFWVGVCELELQHRTIAITSLAERLE